MRNRLFMYPLMLLCFSLTFGSAAMAGGPQADHSGSWASIESRSGWSDGKFPKGFKLTINLKFEKNKLIYSSYNTTDPKHVLHLEWTAPLDGTPAPIANHARFNQISVKKLGPDDFQILEMNDGDVVVGALWHFSADGKTVNRWGVGKHGNRSRVFSEYFSKK